MKMTDLLSQNLNVVYEWEEGRRAPIYGKLDSSVSKSLYLYLKFKFRKELYVHQAEAINAAIEGRHVGICTSTASGKTMCFSVPVFEELLKDQDSRALFIFPIKALSNDQMVKLKQMASGLGLRDVVHKFDGDVKGTEREEAIKKGRILVCTPDVLHYTLLRENNKAEFDNFFKNLKFVIIDECHVYNGVFGSNFAYILRRLRQVCLRKYSFPQFIMASATIGHPDEHFFNLTGIRDIKIVNNDGSPSFGKKYLFLEGARDVFLRDEIIKKIILLIQKGRQFIVFLHTRKEVENLYLELKQRFARAAEYVKPYRAGYEPEDRKGIEDSLRCGTLKGVFSTSALELGIDIPDLEVCMLIGLPGAKSSFLQRVGRVGRVSAGEVYVFKTNNAYDDYYFKHPEEFLHKEPEPNIINLCNRQLMLAHFACARAEAPSFDQPDFSDEIFPREFIEIVDRIRDFDFPDEILYCSAPHFDIQIRNISDPIYKVIVGNQPDDPSIGTISYSQLLREAYPDAAYAHLGRKYRVKRISYTKKDVYVSQRCSHSAVTKPICEVYVKERPTASYSVKSWPGVSIASTSLGIYESVKGYVEKKGDEKIQTYYKQPLMRYFVTQGSVVGLKLPGKIDYAGIQGVATVFENTFPLLYPCSSSDIGSFARTRGEDEAKIYLFDNVAGGLDITTCTMNMFPDLLKKAIENICGCSCGVEGCIKCIIPIGWHSYLANGNKESTLAVLQKIEKSIREHEVSVAEKRAEKMALNGQKFGQPMLAEGSVIFTGKCEEGVVVSSKSFNSSDINDRLYNIKVYGQVKSFLGRSLTLIQGGIELWCTSCGQESIDSLEERCPMCNARL